VYAVGGQEHGEEEDLQRGEGSVGCDEEGGRGSGREDGLPQFLCKVRHVVCSYVVARSVGYASCEALLFVRIPNASAVVELQALYRNPAIVALRSRQICGQMLRRCAAESEVEGKYVCGWDPVRRQYLLAACLKGALQALGPSTAGLAGVGKHLTSARMAPQEWSCVNCVY
jgi:hypothetical protein